MVVAQQQDEATDAAERGDDDERERARGEAVEDVPRVVVQHDEPSQTGAILWGEARNEPVGFDSEEINSDAFAAATGQPPLVVAIDNPSSLFRNYVAGDLELNYDSVAHDFSRSLDPPSCDILRRPRAISVRVDAGAFELPLLNAVNPRVWGAYD